MRHMLDFIISIDHSEDVSHITFKEILIKLADQNVIHAEYNIVSFQMENSLCVSISIELSISG